MISITGITGKRQMHIRNLAYTLAAGLVVCGCSMMSTGTGPGLSGMSSGTGTSGGRDPLLMSHLTHNKSDPHYAGADTDSNFDADRPELQSASVSRKPSLPPLGDLTTTSAAPMGDHADDYSWINGLLERAPGESSWSVCYARSVDGDRFGGRLQLENHPRLGLLRAGDRVHLTGELVSLRPGKTVYRIDQIRMVGP